MKIVPLEETAVTLPQVAELARSGPVILTRNGKPLAAVKNLTNKDWESMSLANNPRFRRIIEESRASYRKEGGIGLQDLREELGLKRRKTGRKRRK